MPVPANAEALVKSQQGQEGVGGGGLDIEDSEDWPDCLREAMADLEDPACAKTLWQAERREEERLGRTLKGLGKTREQWDTECEVFAKALLEGDGLGEPAGDDEGELVDLAALVRGSQPRRAAPV